MLAHQIGHRDRCLGKNVLGPEEIDRRIKWLGAKVDKVILTFSYQSAFQIIV